MVVGRTRDVGTQSTPSCNVKSSSPSPTSTPSIIERNRNHKRPVSEVGDTPNFDSKGEEMGFGVDEGRTIQSILINEKGVDEAKDEMIVDGEDEKNDPNGKTQVYSCLSWVMVMRNNSNSNKKVIAKKNKKMQREKKKKKKKKKNINKQNTRRKHMLLFIPSEKGC